MWVATGFWLQVEEGGLKTYLKNILIVSRKEREVRKELMKKLCVTLRLCAKKKLTI